jgi:hypothetical protein
MKLHLHNEKARQIHNPFVHQVLMVINFSMKLHWYPRLFPMDLKIESSKQTILESLDRIIEIPFYYLYFLV